MGLQNKVAIITGAAAGIGRAIASAFAAEGARVALVDVNEAALRRTSGEIRARGGSAVPHLADVSDPEAVQKVVADVIAVWGRLDALVNNAAIQISKTVVDTTPEEWNRQLGINVGGVFLFSKYAIPHLRATRGAIVNLSSVNAYFVEPQCAGYCATKAAIIGLTKAMAIDHGRDGVRVNCICPGYINAGLAESYFLSQADPDRARAAAGDLHALGRVGGPDEVARVAVFLAGSESSFMTGSVVAVDGGFGSGLPPST